MYLVLPLKRTERNYPLEPKYAFWKHLLQSCCFTIPRVCISMCADMYLMALLLPKCHYPKNSFSPAFSQCSLFVVSVSHWNPQCKWENNWIPHTVLPGMSWSGAVNIKPWEGASLQGIRICNHKWPSILEIISLVQLWSINPCVLIN